MIVDHVCPDCGHEQKIETYSIGVDMMKQLSCDPCTDLHSAKNSSESLKMDIFNLLEISEIPEANRTFNTDYNPHSKKLLEFVRRCKDESMWIIGENYTGKSHAVAYCGFRVIEQYRKKVLWISCTSEFSRLLDDKYSSVAGKKQYFEDRFRYLKNVPILILDDLGKEKITDSRIELIFDVIDCRARERKKIWITSNHSGNEMIEHFGRDHGTAIYRRLEDMIPESNRMEIK